MLSKEEQKQHNIAFWAFFEEKLSRTKSGFNRKVNWASYDTKVRNVYLRTKPTGKGCAIHLEFQNKDKGIRDLQLEQFYEVRKVLEGILGHDVDVIAGINENGVEKNTVILSQLPYNYYVQENWEPLVEAIQTTLISFDEFWSEFYDLFKELQ